MLEPERGKKHLEFDSVDKIVVDMDQPKVVCARNGPLGYWCNEGHSSRSPNQDAMVLDTPHNWFASIDGIGGGVRGEEAANIVGQELQRAFKIRYRGLDNDAISYKQEWFMEHVHRRSTRRFVQSEQSGAAYLAFGIEGSTLEISHAGDVKLAVLDEKGKPIFETEDNVLPSGHLTKSVFSQFVIPPIIDVVPVQEGYRILAGSDGLWDSFSPMKVDQIAALVQNVPLPMAMRILAREARQEMEFCGYDNINFLIYDLHLLH